MIDPARLVTFVAASMAIIVVPGPSVLFTLARGVAWGRTVAVLTVLGNSLGTLVLSAVVAVGLGPLLSRSHPLSVALQIAGGLYLGWLGIGAYRHRHAHAAAMAQREGTKPAVPSIVRQGFTVGILNPKSLVFFAAVFPHFVEPARGSVTVQLLVLGGLFSVMAFASDSTWGLIAGTAREWLAGSTRRLVSLRVAGATVMVCLGALIVTSAFAG